MIAIQFDQIGFSYLDESLFRNFSWEIHDDRCAGLIGQNGSGKSTLFKLASGLLTPDEGFIKVQRGLTIGYLPQEPIFQNGQTVLDAVRSASSELTEVEKGLARIEAQLETPDVYSNEKLLNRFLAEQEKLLVRFGQLGGANFEGRVLSTLRSLGFGDEHFELKVDQISGGQKKLVGLARLAVTQPGLLLLDEPDNHLDLDGKSYLEQFIRNYNGGVVIISHDRFLLDLVVDEIAELEDGRIKIFSGNYSEYVFEKQAALLRQQQLFQAQQKEIVRLEQSAKRLLTWGRVYDNEKFIRRGKNILKRLDRIDKIEQPVLDRKKINLKLSGWVGSNKVLEIAEVKKSFPAPGYDNQNEIEILKNVDFTIHRGERVGLVGSNGSGKSLLFRMILQQDFPNHGEINIGPSVRTGYYAQEHETLDFNVSVIETVQKAGEMGEKAAMGFLTRFLFNYQQAQAKVKTLSGGERSRLQLALLMLANANFLLLDEPTNHLDIQSAEVLENALQDFEGTVLVISHDRYFLDQIVNRVLEIKDGKVFSHPGTYSDYRAVTAGLK